jgi:polyisoprenoid-binding protein YceI
MKKTRWLVLLIFFSQLSQAAIQYAFKNEVGQVRFEAQGRPKLTTISGDGTGVKGNLAQDNNMLKGTVEFNLDTLQTHLALRDRHMKEKYLQTKEHPVATLTDVKITLPDGWGKTVKEAKAVAFTADLSLHGVKKTITGTVDLKSADQKVELKAQFPVKLSEYKIDIPSFMGVTVAEDVKVYVDTTAEVQTK